MSTEIAKSFDHSLPVHEPPAWSCCNYILLVSLYCPIVPLPMMPLITAQVQQALCRWNNAILGTLQSCTCATQLLSWNWAISKTHTRDCWHQQFPQTWESNETLCLEAVKSGWEITPTLTEGDGSQSQQFTSSRTSSIFSSHSYLSHLTQITKSNPNILGTNEQSCCIGKAQLDTIGGPSSPASNFQQ